MSDIKPTLSKKSKYYIEKHRYYELKHFCLQYPIWQKAYTAIDGLIKRPYDLEKFKPEVEDPTAWAAIARATYKNKMELVEQAAIAADSELYKYILVGVTEECTYEQIKARLEIPCSRETYYDRYRKFFWILNKTRE